MWLKPVIPVQGAVFVDEVGSADVEVVFVLVAAVSFSVDALSKAFGNPLNQKTYPSL